MIPHLRAHARTGSLMGVVVLGACVAEPGPPPQPLVCSTQIEGCACGSVGCSCADDGGCSAGTCNPHSLTCVLEQDDMVLVADGEFWMGCRLDVDIMVDEYPEVAGVPRKCEDELNPATPYRRVTLDEFWVDRTEVSKSQYRSCIEAGICEAPGEWDQEYQDEQQVTQATPDEFPVGGLTWMQAKTYCEWAGKRLPTEAEWEKAARGTDGRKYPWGDEPEPDCSLANHLWGTVESGYEACSSMRLMAIGALPANTSPYGAVDMAGNVKEWVADAYEPGTSYAGLPAQNPVQLEGSGRIRRGCSFQCPTVGAGYILRTSIRSAGGDTSWEYLGQGARCARDAD